MAYFATDAPCAKHQYPAWQSLSKSTCLLRLCRLYGSNVCGEGGEYETLTLDCPLFTRARIVLEAWETVLHSPGDIASVGVLRPTAFRLEPKDGGAAAALDADVTELPAGEAFSPWRKVKLSRMDVRRCWNALSLRGPTRESSTALSHVATSITMVERLKFSDPRL